MKKIIVIIICVIHAIFVFSQNNKLQIESLCDGDKCIVPSDAIFGKSPDEIIKTTVQMLSSSKSSNQNDITDFDCDHPSFLIFRNGVFHKTNALRKGKKLFEVADIKSQRCNLKSPQWCYVFYNAEKLQETKEELHCAVNSNVGTVVFMDKCFLELISISDYWCYGLPMEPTKYVRCKNNCGATYKEQQFKSKEGEIRTIYNMGNACPKGKNHANLELEDIGKCAVTPGGKIDIPRD